MTINLQDKPIAITGASSGIGRSTALACARAGMPVAVLARRIDRLESLCDEIRSFGGRAIAVAGDVEHESDCHRLIERTKTEFGSIYAVFANAGYSLEQPVVSMTDDAIRQMFEVNFWGSLRVIRPALAYMRSAGAGHVLWCSSCLSKISMPAYGCYSATKACQDHFARSMRLELRNTGVFVSSIHPIGTRTELFEHKTDADGRVTGAPNHAPSWLMQSPERVARAVVRCLRRPRSEVWTSTSTRLAIAIATAFPSMADLLLARAFRDSILNDANDQG